MTTATIQATVAAQAYGQVRGHAYKLSELLAFAQGETPTFHGLLDLGGGLYASKDDLLAGLQHYVAEHGAVSTMREVLEDEFAVIHQIPNLDAVDKLSPAEVLDAAGGDDDEEDEDDEEDLDEEEEEDFDDDWEEVDDDDDFDDDDEEDEDEDDDWDEDEDEDLDDEDDEDE